MSRLMNGSNANSHFANVPQANIPRSSFNRSHGHKTTFNSGLLIPVFWDVVFPGDTFNMRSTFFARLATPIFPIMDNIYLDVQYFFVPSRLVWENWEEFNGYQANPADSTDFMLPTITSPTGGYTTGSIFDYFGLPTLVNNVTTQVLPLRCYNLIYNEWYRDQNLQDSVMVPTGDGPDDPSLYTLLNRGKRRDYFTSCLPFAQKGTAITIPLGTTAPVVGNNLSPYMHNDPDGVSGFMETTGVANNPINISGTLAGANAGLFWGKTNTNTVDTGLIADLSAATSATINQLRLSFAMQKVLERDARGGTRYVEMIFAHFNVVSPDFRLQRPEFLGSGSTMININPVAQTAPADSTSGEQASPQGTLAGFGTATLTNGGFTQSFVEHGFVIGLVSARADYTYQQGCERPWFYSTRFDFYLPALSHIGEQAVLNQEIFTQGTSADEMVFGYQEAWAELRYKPSRISGLFRSNATGGSLDSWHLSQDFGSLPTLSPAFIIENPPMSRVKAVTTQPDFIFDSHFEYHCARPMPVYSDPGYIDRF